MTCGGGGAKIASGAWVLNGENYSTPTYKQPTECDEGYLARAGNPEKDMAGGPETANKIRNISVPVGLDMSVNTTFELTASSTKPAKSWQCAPLPAGVVFDSSTGTLSGTCSVEGKYSITVSALDSAGATIDSKSYSLVAKKTPAEDAISFIHPMPGSVITSRCTASLDGTAIWTDPKRGRPHKGIDLAYPGGKCGNVIAAASGTVIRADGADAGGYGNLVVIGHTNAAGKKMCLTVYAHLSKINVSVGQNVSAADVIGVEGNTGGSHGAHLHFEIRGADFCTGCGSNQASAVYDPEAYIIGNVAISASSTDPSVVNTVATKSNGGKIALTPSKIDNKCSGYVAEPGNPGPSSTHDYFDENLPPDGMLTIDQLIAIAPTTKNAAALYVPLYKSAFAEFGMVSTKQKKAFVAQTLHESGRLVYTKEIASGSAYEGRSDLGNTQPGDGMKFKGRGLIQITGRANYAKVAAALGIDCVKNPALLEEPANAVRASAWWWKNNGCNALAEAGDFTALTRKINGGTNGLSDRVALLNKCNTVCKV